MPRADPCSGLRSSGSRHSVPFSIEVCMTLIGLIISLIVVGVLLWTINAFIPMDAKIKQILNVVVIIIVVIWLLVNLLPSGGILNSRIGH
jgi:high-affinity K+ transport system ATPase subunit B